MIFGKSSGTLLQLAPSFLSSNMIKGVYGAYGDYQIYPMWQFVPRGPGANPDVLFPQLDVFSAAKTGRSKRDGSAACSSFTTTGQVLLNNGNLAINRLDDGWTNYPGLYNNGEETDQSVVPRVAKLKMFAIREAWAKRATGKHSALLYGILLYPPSEHPCEADPTGYISFTDPNGPETTIDSKTKLWWYIKFDVEDAANNYEFWLPLYRNEGDYNLEFKTIETVNPVANQQGEVRSMTELLPPSQYFAGTPLRSLTLQALSTSREVERTYPPIPVYDAIQGRKTDFFQSATPASSQDIMEDCRTVSDIREQQTTNAEDMLKIRLGLNKCIETIGLTYLTTGMLGSTETGQTISTSNANPVAPSNTQEETAPRLDPSMCQPVEAPGMEALATEMIDSLWQSQLIPDVSQMIQKGTQEAGQQNWANIIGTGLPAPAAWIQYNDRFFGSAEGLNLCKGWFDEYVSAAWAIYIEQAYGKPEASNQLQHCLREFGLGDAGGRIVRLGDPSSLQNLTPELEQYNPGSNIGPASVIRSQCPENLIQPITELSQRHIGDVVEEYGDQLQLTQGVEQANHNWQVIVGDRIGMPVSFVVDHNQFVNLVDDWTYNWLEHYIESVWALYLYAITQENDNQSQQQG